MRRDIEALGASTEVATSRPAWPARHSFGNERLWLDCLLEREILRLRARYELSLDELRGLYISDRQVDELLRQHAQPFAASGAGPGDPAAALTRQAAQWREHFAADSPLALLGERLALSESDLELVFVVLAPELDLRYETLYAYLNNDIARKAATLDLARRLLDGEDPASSSDGARHRAQALIAAGLLERPDPEERRSSLGQMLALARPAAQFLLGIPPLLGGEACCGQADEPLLETIAGSSGMGPSREECARAGNGPSGKGSASPGSGTAGELIVCRSDDGERQARWARSLLSARGRHALHLAAETLLRGNTAILLARLSGAALILHEPAFAIRDPVAAERMTVALEQATAAGLTLLWLVPAGWQAGAAFGRLPMTVLDLAPPTARDRARDWAEAIRAAHLPVGEAIAAACLNTDVSASATASACASTDPVEHLAGLLGTRFSIAGSRIALAVRSARALLDADPGVSNAGEALQRAARQLAAQSLAQVAQPATRPTHRWPQLVLPPTTLQLLREIAGAIAAREQVFREWNMQGRTGRSAGLMLLFAGASGTGKTMAASVLANHVGLELFRVDLAGVISKYIGETEKNLDRIFTAARDADAILLFDEADALLGKRAEVKDAHDRYANIEVAYLLQKMEEHDGVVILASNLPKNLDQAFSRRIHYVVEFARPGAILREQLWRGMFPAEVPLAGDLDYAFLAEQFDLTGGDIQTIALEAAFLAAGEGNSVGMAHAMRAIARRQTKHGDPGVAARFRVYQDALERGRA